MPRERIPRPGCAVDDCGESCLSNWPLCGGHMKMVPDDLRERYRWARTEHDPFELEAACAALIESAE